MDLNKNMLLIVLLLTCVGVSAGDEPAKSALGGRIYSAALAARNGASAVISASASGLSTVYCGAGAAGRVALDAAAGVAGSLAGGLSVAASGVVSGVATAASATASGTGRLVGTGVRGVATGAGYVAGGVGAAAKTTVDVVKQVPWDGLLAGAALIGRAFIEGEVSHQVENAVSTPKEIKIVTEELARKRIISELEASKVARDKAARDKYARDKAPRRA